ADVAEGVAPEIAGIIVPKLESTEQLDAVTDALERAELGHLHVLAGLESAMGVERARELLQPPVAVAYFGAEDFIADMGGVRTAAGAEVRYARSRVALAARLAGVLAVDQVVTQLDAEEHFLADAALGRAIGYRGKLCIHPAQVALANRSFSSSAEELERARRLLAAYDDAVARGEAAIAFEGQRVDEPLARHARAAPARPSPWPAPPPLAALSPVARVGGGPVSDPPPCPRPLLPSSSASRPSSHPPRGSSPGRGGSRTPGRRGGPPPGAPRRSSPAA